MQNIGANLWQAATTISFTNIDTYVWLTHLRDIIWQQNGLNVWPATASPGRRHSPHPNIINYNAGRNAQDVKSSKVTNFC